MKFKHRGGVMKKRLLYMSLERGGSQRGSLDGMLVVELQREVCSGRIHFLFSFSLSLCRQRGLVSAMCLALCISSREGK